MSFVSIIPLVYFLWCLATYMSSRRRLLDAKTSRQRWCYEQRLAATTTALAAAGCTDTRVRPITGPSSPPRETRAAICSRVPYLWPWSCPCRPSVNHHHRRRFKFPTRQYRNGGGIFWYIFLYIISYNKVI